MSNKITPRSRDDNGISRGDINGAMKRVLDAAGKDNDTRATNHPETFVGKTEFTEGLFMRVIILSRFKNEGIHAEAGDCNAALKELFRNFEGQEIKGFDAFWAQDGQVVLYTDRQGRVKIGKICASEQIGSGREDVILISDMQIPGEKNPSALRLDRSEKKLTGKIIPSERVPKNTSFSAVPRDVQPKRKGGVSIMAS